MGRWVNGLRKEQEIVARAVAPSTQLLVDECFNEMERWVTGLRKQHLDLILGRGWAKVNHTFPDAGHILFPAHGL
jgi:hypothetical protein